MGTGLEVIQVVSILICVAMAVWAHLHLRDAITHRELDDALREVRDELSETRLGLEATADALREIRNILGARKA